MTIEKIIDEEGKQINIVRHPKQIVKVEVPKIVACNDFMKILK